MPRKFGHREGAKTFRAITRHAKALGIQYITYYAFSTENWKRPKDEVDAIMDLFEKYLDEVRDFIEENIRVRFIGDRTRLSENLQRKMASVEEDSKDFDSMTLVLAINYGGRDEICHAAKTLAQQVKEGKLEPEDITMDMIERNLYTEEIPPVDLVIRPSGEQRLSNFMICRRLTRSFITQISYGLTSKAATLTRLLSHTAKETEDLEGCKKCLPVLNLRQLPLLSQ